MTTPKITKTDIDNLQWAIKEANRWRGNYLGWQEMVDEHDHNINVCNQSLAVVEAVRKVQNKRRPPGHIVQLMQNVRERMALIADWLGYQEEQMSFGLRSFEDAEKLYDAAMSGDLPEMADEWSAAARKRVLGYDPLKV